MLCNFFVPQILDSNSTQFKQAVCIVSFFHSKFQVLLTYDYFE